MSEYKCANCGRTGCKLWRDYGSVSPLLCCDCAGAEQSKDVSDIDASGRRTCRDGIRTDQIGWYLPAVPTEQPGSFWAYSSVPEERADWWRSLPTRPLEVTQ